MRLNGQTATIEIGFVLLPATPLLAPFLDEGMMRPNGRHKDQVLLDTSFRGAIVMAKALDGLKRAHREPVFLGYYRMLAAKPRQGWPEPVSLPALSRGGFARNWGSLMIPRLLGSARFLVNPVINILCPPGLE